MTMMGCGREEEVRLALGSGHWPEACEEELRGHVAGCARCGDQVLVSQTIRAARVRTARQVPGISAGALWWKAQIRRRQMALEQVQRPLVTAQLFALAVTVMMLGGLVLFEARHGFNLQAGAQALHLDTLWSSAGFGIVTLAGGLGVFVLLGGLVLYLGNDRR